MHRLFASSICANLRSWPSVPHFANKYEATIVIGGQALFKSIDPSTCCEDGDFRHSCRCRARKCRFSRNTSVVNAWWQQHF